jgi:hypothetical protein
LLAAPAGLLTATHLLAQPGGPIRAFAFRCCSGNRRCCGELPSIAGGAPALQGAQIPSDGQSYGTAYCSEIFDGGMNGGMNGGIPII